MNPKTKGSFMIRNTEMMILITIRGITRFELMYTISEIKDEYLMI